MNTYGLRHNINLRQDTRQTSMDILDYYTGFIKFKDNMKQSHNDEN